MKADKEIELIHRLKSIEGAKCNDGEASVQVFIPLKNGTYLRLGVTDDDVAEEEGLWFDIWKKENDRLTPIE